MVKFTNDDIRIGLVDISTVTVKQCFKKFHALRSKQKQGLEKIFHTAFVEATDHPGWTAKSWVGRASFEAKDKFRPKGWVDGVITHDTGYRIGIEFKVCELPRMKWTSPNQATYDVGQLAWDFGALKKYNLDSAYCIAVLHGGLVEMPDATSQGIARSFHNALYTDFQSAKAWGYLKYSRLSAAKRHEKRTIEEMGLDKPYYGPKANPNNFCRLYKNERLAVIGISIR